LIPDAVSYTSMISALARQNNEKDFHLLDDIISMMNDDTSGSNLDSGVYNALIHAKTRTGKAGAAEQAERLLRSMWEDNDSKITRPVSTTICIKNIAFIL